MRTVAFRASVANAVALQHAAQQALALGRFGCQLNDPENAEVVLRDLAQRRVGGADKPEYLGGGPVAYAGAPIGLGYGNAAQPTDVKRSSSGQGKRRWASRSDASAAA